MQLGNETDTLDRLGVSRETIAALDSFASRLENWSKTINLIAPGTVGDIWQRHIIDSAQIFAIENPPPSTWCDLGSGGGLPGIVVAILCKQLSPHTKVSMIESDARKAAFLKLTIKEFDLNATVEVSRLERTAPQNAEIVSARALAPLPLLLGFVHRHIAPGGHALLPKGKNCVSEVEHSLLSWHFDYTTHPSVVDRDSSILKISNLKPRAERV